MVRMSFIECDFGFASHLLNYILAKLKNKARFQGVLRTTDDISDNTKLREAIYEQYRAPFIIKDDGGNEVFRIEVSIAPGEVLLNTLKIYKVTVTSDPLIRDILLDAENTICEFIRNKRSGSHYTITFALDNVSVPLTRFIDNFNCTDFNVISDDEYNATMNIRTDMLEYNSTVRARGGTLSMSFTFKDVYLDLTEEKFTEDLELNELHKEDCRHRIPEKFTKARPSTLLTNFESVSYYMSKTLYLVTREKIFFDVVKKFRKRMMSNVTEYKKKLFLDTLSRARVKNGGIIYNNRKKYITIIVKKMTTDELECVFKYLASLGNAKDGTNGTQYSIRIGRIEPIRTAIEINNNFTIIHNLNYMLSVLSMKNKIEFATLIEKSFDKELVNDIDNTLCDVLDALKSCLPEKKLNSVVLTYNTIFNIFYDSLDKDYFCSLLEKSRPDVAHAYENGVINGIKYRIYYMLNSKKMKLATSFKIMTINHGDSVLECLNKKLHVVYDHIHDKLGDKYSIQPY